ncbi:MAG: hypothetical protein HY093_04935 [Candidatus Liptonbacteria bacterium]|nr:hypothetical protein [Candidatus Liptonbacteria bacterium]
MAKITISKEEYLRLKKLDSKFREFLVYLEEVMDIRERRKEVRGKKVVSQERLFTKLGLMF